MQHAVGAGADAQAILLRLDVHVGRAGAYRRFENQVDDLDDGRVLVDVDPLLTFFGVVQLPGRAVGLELPQRVGDLRGRRVRVHDRLFDLGGGRDDHAHRRAHRVEQPREQVGAQRIRGGDVDAVAVAAHRNRSQLPCELFAQEIRELGVELGAGEVDRLEAGLFGERAGELALGDEPELDEHVAESLAARALRGQCFAELILGEDAAPDEQRAERRSLVLRRVRYFERRHRRVAVRVVRVRALNETAQFCDRRLPGRLRPAPRGSREPRPARGFDARCLPRSAAVCATDRPGSRRNQPNPDLSRTGKAAESRAYASGTPDGEQGVVTTL